MDQEEHPDDCEGRPPVLPDEAPFELTWIVLQMGKFSSDRAIMDYAQEYWNIESTTVA